jgi:hypothetical protein
MRMHLLAPLVVLFAVFGLQYVLPFDLTGVESFAASSETKAPADQSGTPGAQTERRSASPGQALWDTMAENGTRTILVGSLAIAIVVGGAVLLYRAAQAGPNPLILRLGPSFFFWLAMIYTALLLLMAGAYNLSPWASKTVMLGGLLPVAVPWFGALGAVTISLEGVFLWNDQWDRKYNYWHIGRPLFGAVLGIVAFFLFVVTITASGTAPKVFEGTPAAKDLIIFYIVAFLVGYREETFRELIKRATDLILKPGTTAPAAPAVTFRVAGAIAVQVTCPSTAAGTTSHVSVEVQNSGGAPLVAPSVAVSPVGPTPAGTFAVANDHVTGGGDIPAGQARTVDVTFTPPAAAQEFSCMLTVTATNLTAPRTIRVTGRSA